MLNRTRVSGMIDVARLAAAVRSPGIDPRIWISLGVVTAFYFDPKEGPFVDITLLPSELQETARVATLYAGAGWGVWAPLHVDDEVLVFAPSGHPDEGMLVLGRMWSPSDLPPDLAVQNQDDVVWVVQDGKTFRLKTSGDGKILIDSDKDIVFNGGDKAVARVSDSTDDGSLALLPIAPAGTTALVYTPSGGIPVTICTFPPSVAAVPVTPASLSGVITTGADKVHA